MRRCTCCRAMCASHDDDTESRVQSVRSLQNLTAERECAIVIKYMLQLAAGTCDRARCRLSVAFQ